MRKKEATEESRRKKAVVTRWDEGPFRQILKMHGRFLGAKEQSGRYRIRSITESRHRKVVETVLVLGEERNQSRFDEALCGFLDQEADCTAFDGVSRQSLSLRERLQEAEESSISHLGEELAFRSLSLKQIGDDVKHFREAVFLDDGPTADSERILASGLGLTPLDDELTTSLVELEHRLFGEVLKIVEPGGGLPHQVDHDGEERRVQGESLTNQELCL